MALNLLNSEKSIISSNPICESSLSSRSSAHFDDVYEHVKEIGKGTYGVVSMYKNKHNNKQVAVKSLRKNLKPDLFDNEDRTQLYEVSAMKALHHTNIIKYINVYREEGQFKIVMEYLSKGTNFHAYLQICAPLEEDLASYLFNQIADAVLYMHQNGYAHNDIKPSNMFITRTGNITIYDFGAAARTGLRTTNYRIGTKSFLAPEAWHYPSYETKPLDSWAMGITLYYMIMRKYPYGSHQNIYPNFNYAVNRDWSIELVTLIYKLLDLNPQSRISSRNIKSHPWLLRTKTSIPSLW